MPVELRPVFGEFGQVNAVPSAQGTIGGYVFYRNDGQYFPVAGEDCLWIRHLSPVSPLESTSLLGATAYHSDSDLYMAIYQRDYLKDGRFPPVYLTTDQPVTDEKTIKRMQDMFARHALGVRRGGKPPILTHGATASPMAISPKDALYAEVAQLTASDIHRITGVPEGLFAKDTTFASSRTHEMVFIKHTIQPECDGIAAQMTHGFRKAFGADDRLVIRCPDLTPVDPEASARIRKLLFETGQRTVNDYLREDGLEDTPDGDQRYISISLRPIESPDQADTGPDISAADRRSASSSIVNGGGGGNF